MTNHTEEELCNLLRVLINNPQETEWIEFKHNNVNAELIGRNLSALANAALLHSKDRAYLVWGIDDKTVTVH